MVSSVITTNGVQDHQGYCSRCGRIWTLKTEQGVCPWCGKLATCQTRRTQALRSFNSRSNSNRKQTATHGKGYDRLTGVWAVYYKIASRFTGRVRPDDKDDILHDIISTLADVERNNGHQPFTEAAMYRIASRTVADYWRQQYQLTRGLDCRHCSQEQKAKCRTDDLYRLCPKAVKLESLNKPIIDDDGNTSELGDLIADDKAIDLNAWIEAKTFLLEFPQRLLQIANKLYKDEVLTPYERLYLFRFRKREQKQLFT